MTLMFGDNRYGTAKERKSWPNIDIISGFAWGENYLERVVIN